jgi:hypothetical protein
MRRYLTVQSTLALFATLVLVLMLTRSARPGEPPKAPAAPIPDADKNLPRDDDFIVHEWGTFTSFAGSDGVSLDFRTTTSEDLPAFVVDRQKQSFLCESRDKAYARGLTVKDTVLSRQRMETPVTYFYTPKERTVDVSVEFPRGLLTEFYPPVRQFGPAYKKDQAAPLENSFLRWGKVRLLPEQQAKDPKTGLQPFIPKISSGENEHYAYARETDSAVVQITDPAMLATYREKFLFYRGVGNFDLPVRLEGLGEGRFTLTHSGKTPLRYAFLMQVGEDGRTIRFARYENVIGSVEMALPSQTDTLDHLAGEVTKCLMLDGLYEKEARAMVKTWRSSWFGEPGTRVLYSLPREATDALLPLHLDPAPKELVRVMIGRLETLTPEQERGIEERVARLGANDAAVREETAAEIRRLGRFAEPALARVAAVSDDPEIRSRAQTLGRELLTGRSAEKQPK